MSEAFRNSPTFRLFKREPSFIDGVASLVDHSPNLERYRQDRTPQEADVNSLRADWFAIGNDLHEAINAYATK
jgi:hypothetical protein